MLALMIRKVLIMLSIYPNFHTQALLPATVYISGFWSSFGKYTIVKLLLQKLLQNSHCLKQGDEPLHSVNNNKWTGFQKSRCQEGRQCNDDGDDADDRDERLIVIVVDPPLCLWTWASFAAKRPSNEDLSVHASISIIDRRPSDEEDE